MSRDIKLREEVYKEMDVKTQTNSINIFIESLFSQVRWQILQNTIPRSAFSCYFHWWHWPWYSPLTQQC